MVLYISANWETPSNYLMTPDESEDQRDVWVNNVRVDGAGWKMVGGEDDPQNREGSW